MKTKADLLAHITALTESGDMEWGNAEYSHYMTHTMVGATECTVWIGSDGIVKVDGECSDIGMLSLSLYAIIDGRQPLPEWAQKVGE